MLQISIPIDEFLSLLDITCVKLSNLQIGL